MKFELTEKQVEILNNWKEKIKTKHGKYGQYTFKFSPTGISSAVFVYSHLDKSEIDLSLYEEW